MSNEAKKSEFDKVLNMFDILVIAFGAMIGWGWVVSSGSWIMSGGIVGAMLGFAAGGVMIFFVGLTYAELTAAMPQSGGEHVFSFKAMGPLGSFICTWAIILGYVGVVCFEACAFPTIIAYILPSFNQFYLYSVAGFDIYATWLVVGVVMSFLIMMINIKGAKKAAQLQTALTVIIGGVGIVLIVASVVTGDIANVQTQVWSSDASVGIFKSILSVALVTPFFFLGFDVIPQAAEEINVPLKQVGKIMILSIVLAVSFYALIILAVGLVMNVDMITESMNNGQALVTADAMAAAFNSAIMAKVLILGGLCGIVTSWNSFLIGGSRAMYSMADACMIPRIFAKVHKTNKTPVTALWLIGILSMIAPFFGRQMLVWLVDAGNFGCCVAYCMVAISFVILRYKEPDMPRPYVVKHFKFVGAAAIILTFFMVMMYVIPNSGATLVAQEWIMVGGWIIIGVIFYIGCKMKYKEEFASHVDVENEELSQMKKN
ncbi:MAG: APC family permease [Eubacteriales bacterium]